MDNEPEDLFGGVFKVDTESKDKSRGCITITTYASDEVVYGIATFHNMPTRTTVAVSCIENAYVSYDYGPLITAEEYILIKRVI